MKRIITRDEFVAAISSDKGDRFAKTFVSKADMQGLWDLCIGHFIEGELAGAIITTISKRQPAVANLQLLHTFVKFRGKGVARKLVLAAVEESYLLGAKYFRVSSEPDAVEFYKKCDFEFAGKQKSGCQLSIFRFDRFNGTHQYACSFDYSDPVIRAAVFRKGKGGCVEIFFKDPLCILDID